MSSAGGPGRRRWWQELHWQVGIALLLSVILGLATAEGTRFHEQALAVYSFVGTLFLNALKMLIVPLVFCSVVSGIANTGGRGFGRIGGKTLAYYLATTALAATLGLLLVNIFQPGILNGEPARQLFTSGEVPAAFAETIEASSYKDIVDVFVRMVPPNIISAAADNGQMLGLIFFALLSGFFITRTQEKSRELLTDFIGGAFEVMLLITAFVMRFAPLGVLALVSRVFATSDFDQLVSLLKFLAVVMGGLALHFFGTMTIIMLLARINPLKVYRAMAPALLTAFSTSSSSATLPVTMDCIEQRAGVSNRVSSFVLPMGATVNMDGTALFEVVAALFVAQAYGLELSIAAQISVVVLALTTSIGVAGVPSASMVAIVLILGTLGLPAEAIGLIFAVDRLPDMCRTVVNIFGDAVGALIIAKSEGEIVLPDKLVPAAVLAD